MLLADEQTARVSEASGEAVAMAVLIDGLVETEQ
jgi:hypothetical protein